MKNKYIVPIIILLVAGMFFYVNIGPSVPDGYADFQAVEAQSQLQSTPDVRVLDVRTPAEFVGGHIRNAENIDYYAKDFTEKLDTLDRDTQYFIYCHSGSRSSSTMKKMAQLGFTKVWHLSDGITSWIKAGLPLER